MRKFCWLVALSLVMGCGDDAGPGSDGSMLPGLQTLEVAPATASLSVDVPGAAMTQPFTATGVFQDGSRRDVSSQVAWTLDNGAIGTISGAGLFTTSNQAGGSSRVTASSGQVAGMATVDVTLH